MSTRCPVLKSCETICEEYPRNHDSVARLRAAREELIARSTKHFGAILDVTLEAAEVPPRILQQHAKDNDRVAAVSQQITALEQDIIDHNARIEAALPEVCDTCPIRQLDLRPLPPQE